MSEIKIDNRDIPRQTQAKWMPRQVLGTQGDARPVYGPVRAFELRWNIQSTEDWEVLVAFFDEVQSTGTVTCLLPAYPTATGTPFAYREYSGCVLSEPTIGAYFNEQYPTDVALLIGNIVTS